MKLKQNFPRRLMVLGLVVAGVLLGCAQSVTAQWSPMANPTPTPGTNIWYNSGNVGIGTTSPVATLHMAGGNGTGSPTAGATLALGYSTTGQYPHFISTVHNAGTGTANAINFYTSDGSANSIFPTNAVFGMTITNGNIGIGTTSPGQKLDVVGGNINVSASSGVGGDITLTGTIHAKYQDVAEWVRSTKQLAAGTVVVLDPTKSNQVTSSSVSYDTRVAGVISAQPGIALGEKSDSTVLVATTGRVKVKVDASKSPIHIGDLLVTSDISGVAMKSETVNLGGVQIHRPGTLIGKALEPLEKGKGEILVLLSLQ